MFLASQKSPDAWLHWLHGWRRFQLHLRQRLLGYCHGQGHIHQAPEDVNNLTDASMRGHVVEHGHWNRLDNMCSLLQLKALKALRTFENTQLQLLKHIETPYELFGALAKLRRRK